MTAPLRRHECQGTGGNGRATTQSVIARLLGEQHSRSDTQTPMWLRDLRRDRREFIV